MELVDRIGSRALVGLHVLKTALDLKPGEEALISELRTESMAIKFMELGVMMGAKIKFLRRLPFGGACYIRVNDTCLALRQSEMSKILICGS